MDLEELNKTQIILLTLLVSFVTSIATGIVTVTLMDQAPPAVTQTINRVVERTVERVVPAEVNNTDNDKEATVIEKETTVVVKEDDLITESIETNKATLARLVGVVSSGETTGATSTTETVFHGIGVFVTDDGLVATADSVAEVPELFAVTSDGLMYATKFVGTGDNGIGFVQLVPDEGESPSFRTVSFAKVANLKLGQTVIVLQGESRTNVAMGIIAGLIEGEKTNQDKTTSFLKRVDTNIANSMPGSPLINIFGEVVGIDTTGNSKGSFVSSNLMREDMTLLTPGGETVQADTEETGG